MMLQVIPPRSARTHTCKHAYIHTHIHTHVHTYIQTCIHTYIRTYIHTYIHTYMHMCVITSIHTSMHIPCIGRYLEIVVEGVEVDDEVARHDGDGELHRHLTLPGCHLAGAGLLPEGPAVLQLCQVSGGAVGVEEVDGFHGFGATRVMDGEGEALTDKQTSEPVSTRREIVGIELRHNLTAHTTSSTNST